MPPRAECLVLASTLALGGGERVLAKMIRELRAIDFTFHIITLKEEGVVGEALRKEGISLESWNLADTKDVRILPRLIAVLRSRAPGLLYIQDHHDCLFWGSLASAISSFTPTVIPVHSSGQRGATSFRRMNRFLLGLGQVLVLLGPWHHRVLRDEDGLFEGPRATIPNPLDSSRFSPAGRPGNREMILGTVAALRSEKRHDLLLRLFAELLRLRSARLIIAGDGPERSALERLSLELGVSGRVEFLGARENVAEILSTLDLFVLTSEVEAQPLSLIEAMACGVAVAAPPRGGIPEIMDDGNRGLLLRGENTADWARQIDGFLRTLPTSERLATIAGEVAGEFSDQAFVARYAVLFERVSGLV